ncbi:MAG: endopeptidase La [Clostridiales bacterium]|nr:endopeptidase La [Clostridiales bacterium]
MTVVTMPLLALRGLTVFPNMTINFDIGRDVSLGALEVAMENDQKLFLVSQIDPNIEEPKIDDLYTIGTIVHVKQMLKLPGDTVRVLVEGEKRAEILKTNQLEPYIEVDVEAIDSSIDNDAEISAETEALVRSLVKRFEEYGKLSSRISPEVLLSVSVLKDLDKASDIVASNALFKQDDKQEILELFDVLKRTERLIVMLDREIEMQKIEKKINTRVKKQIDKMQKEHYLHEQVRAIQTELGEDDENEVDEFNRKIEELPLDEDVRKKVKKEISRLARLPQGSPETAVVRTWLEWIVDLPWTSETEDNLDLNNARTILDEDHYGLQKVKERIIEYLAVCSMTKNMKGPILCFVGPPGVGKTSIARSIARAIGRKFARMSLGGVRDEAEIRGHRRTYVGAIPGRVISNIKQVGSNNPVFLFDEIDKMSNDFRGDPASAMLEVLDSEQNYTFTDHYLEIPFDVSKVMFLATANSLSTIPPALLDRMEVIYLSGYTQEEKLHIAKKYLLPKQLKEHGLDGKSVMVSDNTITSIITDYTREAGVRNLEREIANLCRKCAKEIIDTQKKSIRVTKNKLEKLLGVARFMTTNNELGDKIGEVTGLAWTAVGGVTLNIEVNIMKGTGKLELTGQLGDVMKESAIAALSYIRSNAKKFGIDEDFYKGKDVHIHIPEGAIPKDGPSAGISMATAMISALSKKRVSGKVAMTGEITLRGRVLPIGGLKEKVLAAHRAGIETVIIPKDNTKDISEIPDFVLKKIEIIPCDSLKKVLDIALVKPIKKKKKQDNAKDKLGEVNAD